MTPHSTITIGRLDGLAAGQTEGPFTLVYAEVYAEPPYNETEPDVTAAVRRFRTHTRKRTFRAALARTADGRPVGMAYGYHLGPDTGWWDDLAEPVPADLRREDGHRTFGLIELAVRAPWRGRGIARRLHETLLDGITTERVLLNVHPGSRAAVGAYRSWGYRQIGRTRPAPTGQVYVVMALGLPSLNCEAVDSGGSE